MKRCLLVGFALIACSCASATEAVDARPAIDATAGVTDANTTDGNPLIDAPVGTPDAMTGGPDAPVGGADASQPLNIGLKIVEVYYDHTSDDDGFEWVKLYNGTASPINLGNYALGWGGTDYTYGVMDLAGTVAAYDCFVIGGPSGNAVSGSPSFDLGINFQPDLQNSGATADGVAVFNLPASGITPTSTPVHAVIYGGTNTSNLYDENGANGDVDIGDGPDENSLRMKADQSWEINPAPTPNACLPFP